MRIENFLVTFLVLLLMPYCEGIQIKSAQDLIGYVAQYRPDNIDITFSPRLTPEQRTEILNEAFVNLAQRNLSQHITKLNLSHNELQIAPLFNGFDALKTLDLSHNQLTEVPYSFSLNRIQNLDLSGNKLRKLDMTSLYRLKFLNLSDNQLVEAPNIMKLDALEVIDLTNNPSLTRPLIIPLALQGKLKVIGYNNVQYQKQNELFITELLSTFLTQQQIEEILPQIIDITDSTQAKVVSEAWLSQQESGVQDSSTNIIFVSSNIFFTPEGFDYWQRINYHARSLLGQELLIRLPLHSIHALLTKLYGNYDLDRVPVEDPVLKHIDFVVNEAEFFKLVNHFIALYNIVPLTEPEKESCKKPRAEQNAEQLYLLKNIVELIQHKKNLSSETVTTSSEFITADAAIKMLQDADLPKKLTDSQIAMILRPLTTVQGIKRASVEQFIKSRKKALQEPMHKGE